MIFAIQNKEVNTEIYTELIIYIPSETEANYSFKAWI